MLKVTTYTLNNDDAIVNIASASTVAAVDNQCVVHPFGVDQYQYPSSFQCHHRGPLGLVYNQQNYGHDFRAPVYKHGRLTVDARWTRKKRQRPEQGVCDSSSSGASAQKQH